MGTLFMCAQFFSIALDKRIEKEKKNGFLEKNLYSLKKSWASGLQSISYAQVNNVDV